jgi:hypothetical protein
MFSGELPLFDVGLAEDIQMIERCIFSVRFLYLSDHFLSDTDLPRSRVEPHGFGDNSIIILMLFLVRF